MNIKLDQSHYNTSVFQFRLLLHYSYNKHLASPKPVYMLLKTINRWPFNNTIGKQFRNSAIFSVKSYLM